jgi:hypothetical protein
MENTIQESGETDTATETVSGPINTAITITARGSEEKDRDTGFTFTEVS